MWPKRLTARARQSGGLAKEKTTDEWIPFLKTSKTSFNKGLPLGKKGLGKIALVSFIHDEVKKTQI